MPRRSSDPRIIGAYLCALATASLAAGGPGGFADCNNNGVPDETDIAVGTSRDCNANQIPDECELAPSEQELIADDVVAEDWFGHALALHGDTAVISAPWQDVPGVHSGAAYVFKWNGPHWEQEQKLNPAGLTWYDNFGASTAISADAIVVGMPHDCDFGTESGSAFLFRHDGVEWVQAHKFYANDAARFDYFGVSVGISGECVVVGAHANDDAGDHSGSAYVFRADGADWIEQQLAASDGAAGDAFGAAVAISGDWAVIGANGCDAGAVDSGAAYVFHWDGAGWSETQKLTASDAGASEAFGAAAAMSQDMLVVGAPGDGDSSAGAAYVFRRDGTSWIEERKLTASDAELGDYFGCSVDVADGTIVVGAPWNDDDGDGAGAAYVFRRDGSGWIEAHKLTASDADQWDWFGYAVATNGWTAACGAVGGDNGVEETGSAYMYDLTQPADCNGNGVLDECDVADGWSLDLNANETPDECECPADLNGDWTVDLEDLERLLEHYGEVGAAYLDGDLDRDGDVDLRDLAHLLGRYGDVCGSGG